MKRSIEAHAAARSEDSSPPIPIASRPGTGAAPRPLDWESLYETMGERIFRLCHRMTGDAEQAADLVHDTFVRVAERFAQFDGRGPLEGWVFRIARNLTLKKLERGRRRTVASSRPEGVEPFISDGDVEARIVLRSAVATLEDEYRVPLVLFAVDGYSHKEIGEMLGCAEGTSRARVSRAKARLRELLKHRL